MKRKACIQCGKSYNPNRRTQKFCSSECRHQDTTNRRAVAEGRPEPYPRQALNHLPKFDKRSVESEIDWDIEMAMLGINAAISLCETNLKHLKKAQKALQGGES